MIETLNKIDGIVILTGAGISKESGLDTFRDPDGIWARHSLEEVATPEGFARNPILVHQFYNARRRQLDDPAIQPNAAHLALAKLESDWPGEVVLVTQNVDNLHERAGSQNLIHMHGEIAKSRCAHCGDVRLYRGALDTSLKCPACNLSGGMRPDVVWFGEMPMHMDCIADAIGDCGLFVSIGTSGTVYPAAGFVSEARHNSQPTYCIELNLEETDTSPLFHESRNGKATELVPAFVDEVLARV
ncbi:MAG: NAD-dependent deacylase [Pseudomonadota bacterium]